MNLILLEEADFIDSENSIVRLTGRRLNHVRSVCKVSATDTLRVGLMNGKCGSGTVLHIDEERLDLQVELSMMPPPLLHLTLIMALPRPKSLVKSLQAAASLGIKKIFIIESWRVEKSYWSSPVLRPERLQQELMLGLEQGRDTIMPEVEIRRRFKPFAEDELSKMLQGSTGFVAHPYDSVPCPFNVRSPIVLLIGPEGGFIPYEISLLQKIGCTSVTIGERILRVETAIAAFAGRLC